MQILFFKPHMLWHTSIYNYIFVAYSTCLYPLFYFYPFIIPNQKDSQSNTYKQQQQQLGTMSPLRVLSHAVEIICHVDTKAVISEH